MILNDPTALEHSWDIWNLTLFTPVLPIAAAHVFAILRHNIYFKKETLYNVYHAYKKLSWNAYFTLHLNTTKIEYLTLGRLVGCLLLLDRNFHFSSAQLAALWSSECFWESRLFLCFQRHLISEIWTKMFAKIVIISIKKCKRYTEGKSCYAGDYSYLRLNPRAVWVPSLPIQKVQQSFITSFNLSIKNLRIPFRKKKA